MKLLLGLMVGMLGIVTAQAGADRTAYQLARGSVSEAQRSEVLSLYGRGSASTIGEWFITFADPTTESKGRIVVIKAGKVERVIPSDKTQNPAWSFDPALIKVDIETALTVAQKYAQQNAIGYDGTRVLLRRSKVGAAPVWKVDFKKGETSKGSVYLTTEGTFARYEGPTAKKGSGGGFFQDVEKTFK
jgi:hypothetical protein